VRKRAHEKTNPGNLWPDDLVLQLEWPTGSFNRGPKSTLFMKKKEKIRETKIVAPRFHPGGSGLDGMRV
jgi:hypothetical protein